MECEYTLYGKPKIKNELDEALMILQAEANGATANAHNIARLCAQLFIIFQEQINSQKISLEKIRENVRYAIAEVDGRIDAKIRELNKCHAEAKEIYAKIQEGKRFIQTRMDPNSPHNFFENLKFDPSLPALPAPKPKAKRKRKVAKKVNPKGKQKSKAKKKAKTRRKA